MTSNLSLDLGRFVAGLRYEQVPLQARKSICIAFVDTLGVAIAGAREPAVQLLKAMLSPTGGPCTLLGRQGRAGVLDAAWINGCAAHALDFDDVSQRGIGHASASLVPAILAEGEAMGASGAQMIAAYAAGYETIAELMLHDADVGRYHDKGWHPTGVFGALAAAAACANLRQLTAQQCAMALGLAASQACGLVVNVGTMAKPFHTGRAAHAGVVSARLVASGFTAATDALEHAPSFLHAFSFAGRVDDKPAVRAGIDWQICKGNQISIKKYPTCYCTHRAIDGMFDMLREQPLSAADVEHITVSISRRNVIVLRNHLPQTGLEAKFSIEFALAAPIIAGRVGLAELADDFVLRPDVQALMQKVRVVPDDRDNIDRPGYAIHDRVIVARRKASKLDSGPIAHVRGDHDSPLSIDDLWSKFEDCIRVADAGLNARALFDQMVNLAQVMNIRDLGGKLG